MLPNKPDGPGQLRVLIVDDIADCADTLALLLELYNHATQVAMNGPAALQVAQAFSPDVVILDIGLPGMDGYQLARRMCELPAKKPLFLIAITGHCRETDRRHSAEAGIDLHLTKPADPEKLRIVLDRFKNLVYPVGV